MESHSKPFRSIVSKSWLEEYLPSSKLRNIEELLGEDVGLNSKLRNIEELIGEDVGLNLRTANGGTIPFEGWVEVQFQLSSDRVIKFSNCTIPHCKR